MPNSYIKKLASEGHGSIAELERKWDKAKEAADDPENYAVVTTIFKNMIVASALNAKARLLATEIDAVKKFVPPRRYESILEIPNFGKRLVSEGKTLARQYPEIIEALRNV